MCDNGPLRLKYERKHSCSLFRSMESIVLTNWQLCFSRVSVTNLCAVGLTGQSSQRLYGPSGDESMFSVSYATHVSCSARVKVWLAYLDSCRWGVKHKSSTNVVVMHSAHNAYYLRCMIAINTYSTCSMDAFPMYIIIISLLCIPAYNSYHRQYTRH